ncbi:hypothetical protein [Mycobacterium hubeiense]|nr:hypothetical protein [Mycobacterium sp. QGD 101]
MPVDDDAADEDRPVAARRGSGGWAVAFAAVGPIGVPLAHLE